MFVYVEPPNEKIQILKKILKVLCVLTLLIGLFRITSSQKVEISSMIYIVSGLLYILSWRGLAYYYCLFNMVANVSIIMNLLQEMARLLQNGLYQTYFSGSGFYKMGCLIFSIIAIYFDFTAYKSFKKLALQIYEYEQKMTVQQ